MIKSNLTLNINQGGIKMREKHFSSLIQMGLMSLLLIVILSFANSALAVGHSNTTNVFAGSKVNKGTASFTKDGNKKILSLSDDFQVPDTPDPHWQVVDSKGNVYLLQRLGIKGDKVNTSIILPSYILDVVKVQIWCAFAEALLGEASFESPVN